MRKMLVPVAVAASLLTALPASAHDEMSVAGQVTAVTANAIKLKTADGRAVSLSTDGNTRVMMGTKRLGLKDVKPGQQLKVLGFGDTITALAAIDIDIVPPKSGKAR